MLTNVIMTALDNMWYEIWMHVDEEEGRATYTAIRYDAEMGMAHTVTTEWEQRYAERMVRYDMANQGVL